MKERLIEILQNHDYYAHCERCTRYIKACESCRDERIADHLIENGVVLPLRCAECENSEICPDTLLWCNEFSCVVSENEFCSRAKRKEQP